MDYTWFDEVDDIEDDVLIHLLDDGWDHEIPPGTTPPEFDTREEEAIDRL